MGNIIEARGLLKRYKIGAEIITALDHVDLSIEEGEFLAILGTSGSGKSTMLNMLAALERPTKGEIRINNVSLNKVKEKDMAKFRSRQMGFIFQSFNLLPSLTALENVMLPLTIRGIPNRMRIKKSKKMLEQLGLGHRVNNKPTQMSGGQQQRVSIARALVNEPKILFADEPTGNLDTKTTVEIMNFLTDIVRKEGKTLVMVTHDLSVARYADRIIHMVDGKIIKEERNIVKEESLNEEDC